jgi:hypothetical protein
VLEFEVLSQVALHLYVLAGHGSDLNLLLEVEEADLPEMITRGFPRRMK